MKKLIYLVVVLAIAGGGYWYYQGTKAPEIPEFMKATISQGDIVEEVTATGTLQATKAVPVGSQVSGRVEAVYADFNDIVHKGQVLAKIDTSLLETQVAVQEANIQRQEVDLANQRVQLADAKTQLARQQQLFEAKLTTEQALEAAKLTVSSREAQIASAEKSMVQTQINLEQAKLNVGYATIVSPIDGVVITRAADPGMTVQSSQTVATLFSLAEDLTTLKLEGGVDESEIGKVRTGMVVRFTVDAYPNQEFMGAITRVRLNPVTQSNVVTYTTVATVRNDRLLLKPGMTASMRIEVSRADNALRIPAAALRFRPTNDMYKVLGQEPPAAPGRGGGRGAAGAGAPGAGTTPTATPTATPAATPAAGGPAAGAPAATTPAANPFAGGGRTGGAMSPEAMAAMRGGRTGGRGGGRGGRQGSANGQTGPVTPLTDRGAQSIDELFPPIVRNPTRGQVYVLEPADATHPFGTLKRVDIQYGISNGTFTQLISGPPELANGSELITNVLMPWLTTSSSTSAPTQGNPFQGGGGGRGGRGR